MELLKIYDKKLLTKISKLPWKTDADRKKKNDLLLEHIQKTLPLLNKKKLKPVNLMGHELSFFTYWNKFVTGKKLAEKEYNYLVAYWSATLSHTAINYKFQKDLITAIGMEFRTGSEYCKKTGVYIATRLDEKLNFTFEKSVSVKVVCDGKTYDSVKFEKLTDLGFKNKITEKIVEFKTGNLLVNDWFRCKNNEFSEAVKDKNEDYSEEGSINNPRGVISAISRLAELGVVSVNVGNSCPQGFKIKDTLLFGEYKYKQSDDDGWAEMKKDKTHLGSVCTDLWNVSIIDESQFVKILMDSGISEAKANQHLKEVRKKVDIKLKVKPGKYKLSFCGEAEEFNSKFRKKHKNKLPAKYVPYFTLEKIK